MVKGKIKLKHNENYYLKVLLQETKIKEIMTPSPVSIDVDTPFREVPQKFKEHSIRHLPVVDKKNKVVGIMTQRDLYKTYSPRKLEDGTWYYDENMLNNIILANVMTKKPYCMKEEDCMGDAVVSFVQLKYGSIIVTNKAGILKGILTQSDLLKVAAQIYKE